ncbi:uncharacterized protein LOC126810144 [Patella vulgata]|uniref:uncharacterized protein LOC126810144 n=1 Tax=Patella vulgata TaxID=6465 RepID=UPI00218044CD|nr:uncharacterized protein LOC126810144 [Patella vulgata]XP_050391100.1 uncharacterized protein LOC126810144 [Patella vulgata]
MGDPYKKMLIEIGSKIKENELKVLIFYAHVPGKIREKITMAIQLFEILEQREDLGPKKLAYLKQMLSNLSERKDLLTIIETYEKSPNGISRENTMDAVSHVPNSGLQNVRTILAKNLGKNWRFLFRRLGVADEDIEYIDDKCDRDMREKIHQTFQFWLDNNRQNASSETIITALRKEERNDIIRKIQSGED